ncbi:hypothetical protein [Paenibacillus campi]|nr:hypothetical protein [Paenibacillus sp. SGZ-1009]
MKLRANALEMVMHHQKTLVEQQYGKYSTGTGFYYRPIGGMIEFGEHF